MGVVWAVRERIANWKFIHLGLLDANAPSIEAMKSGICDCKKQFVIGNCLFHVRSDKVESIAEVGYVWEF